MMLSASCSREQLAISPARQMYLEAIEAVEFECLGEQVEVFFEGQLNGEPICFGDGIDQYAGYVRRGTGVQLSSYEKSGAPASGSWVEFGFGQESFTHLQEEIVIVSPTDPDMGTLSDLLRTYLAEGPLPIRDALDPFTGFNIKILIPYDFPNINVAGKRLFSLQTATGNQDNSRLEVVKMDIMEIDDLLEYNLTLELNCTLYNEINDATDGAYFGELTDGRMSIRFAVPR